MQKKKKNEKDTEKKTKTFLNGEGESIERVERGYREREGNEREREFTYMSRQFECASWKSGFEFSRSASHSLSSSLTLAGGGGCSHCKFFYRLKTVIGETLLIVML